MLDDQVRAVLARLEQEDADAITPATGRFLFSIVAPQNECGVLEIGASRGYSTIWLAAGVRYFAGSVLSIESDVAKAEAWRRNLEEAGLVEYADLVEGDPFEVLPRIQDVFDVVFVDAEPDDYERLFALARDVVEPGALVIAHGPPAAYSAARQADPSLVTVTVPHERGLELTVFLG